MAQLKLNVVLFDGETIEDVVSTITQGYDVQCEYAPGHNQWSMLIFTGPESVLRIIKLRYRHLGDDN